MGFSVEDLLEEARQENVIFAYALFLLLLFFALMPLKSQQIRRDTE